MASIGYLWPEWQTYWWLTAKEMMAQLAIDAQLVWEKDQAKLLQSVLTGTSEHVACVVAYSNNLWPYGVSKIWEDMVRFARTQGRFLPEQLIALGRTKIEQCLIGQPQVDIKEITTIFAHPQAANQTTLWRNTHLRKAKIVVAPSNGDAINQALQAQDPSIAAIGPAFWVQQWLVTLHRWIDNTVGSVTNFALIGNRKHPEKLDDVQETWKFWTIVFVKLENLSPLVSFQKLTSLLLSHSLDSSLVRTMNSPHSGSVIVAVELTSDTQEKLQNFLQDLQAWAPKLRVSITSLDGANLEYTGMGGSIEESQYLGPCPVVHVSV